MAVTIKDVARETNLAISTISKYMNGGSVREKNRILIEKAIEKLGYSPNSAARGLRTSRSYAVGVITGVIRNPHAAGIVSEIEKSLREKGYALSFASHDDRGELAKKYVDYLVDKGVDGLIIDPVRTDVDYLEKAREQKIPVVVLEESFGLGDVDCVQVDCAGGAYELVEHLVKSGHRKIAVIQGPEYQLTARERMRGYLRVHEDYELPVCSDYLVQGDFTYKAGYEGICRLWELEVRPTAVFVTNYEMCLGAMAAVHRLDIRIPQELSVVSFDDFELSVMVRPKLTTVRQPLVEMADRACEILLRRMDSDYQDFPRKLRLKPEFICRDSVAAWR